MKIKSNFVCAPPGHPGAHRTQPWVSQPHRPRPGHPRSVRRAWADAHDPRRGPNVLHNPQSPITGGGTTTVACRISLCRSGVSRQADVGVSLITVDGPCDGWSRRALSIDIGSPHAPGDVQGVPGMLRGACGELQGRLAAPQTAQTKLDFLFIRNCHFGLIWSPHPRRRPGVAGIWCQRHAREWTAPDGTISMIFS